MAQIESWFAQDLKKPVKVQMLNGNLFSQDNQGNLIGVKVYDDDEPASLAGTVSANIIRADGGTVAATGTLDGNKCSVVLPAAAYAIPGLATIVIKLTSSGVVTTLLALVVTVYRSSTDTAVDPGTVMPSIQTLIQQINTAVASIPADYSSLWTSLAPAFSTDASYVAGQYVTNNGKVYRFNTAHSGAWAAGDVSEVKLGNELTDLKSALTNSELNLLNGSILGFGENKYMFELGGISSATGDETSSNTRIRSGFFWVMSGTTFTIPSTGDADLYAFFYDSDGSFLHETSGGWSKSYTSTKKCIARIVLRKNSADGTISPSEVDTIAGSLTITVPTMEPIPLASVYTTNLISSDSLDALKTPGTYAIQTRAIALALGAPIDQPGRLIVMQTSQTNRVMQIYVSNTAKARIALRFLYDTWREWCEVYNTSDKGGIISDTLSVFLPQMDAFRFKWTLGLTISGAGTEISNTKWATTDIVKINTGNIIINETPDTALDNKGTAFHVATYKGSVFYERVQLTNGNIYQIPEEVTGIRLVYGFPTSTQGAPAMSMPILDDYFMVRMANFVQPTNYIGDGEHPAYVAFGASTTVGAVHHYDGEDITYSAYAFPEYLGRVLNLKTYNLGLGSTGIMNRTVTRGNFMDQIYNNADILSKAKLVTLMFGYGNDHYVGEIGDQIEFPIGSYDDYYPYDAEGYHPSGMAGCKAMVQMGATFMGCLNWCIKWINEHYPYAQLICIFGSPSANMDRSIALTAQIGSTGIAPYKMTFADPYSTAEAHTTNYMINQINTEINKLAPKLDVPIVNLFFGGNCFSWYSTYAKKPNNESEYALFSTKGTPESPEWNSHPNDDGYLYYARFIAGKVAALFVH